MIHSSDAIAIHHIRYGDNAAVVHLFSREVGYAPFMVRGVHSKKGSKRQLLQPLSLVEVGFRHREDRDMQTATSLRRSAPTSQIQSDIVKTSIALFLGEFLYRTLQAHYQNTALFDYLWQAILELERAQHPANFHLKILIDLAGFYGIAPHGTATQAPYLDLEHGRYLAHPPAHAYVAGPEETALLSQLSGMNFVECQALNADRQLRNALLDKLIEYFAMRLPGVNALNSRDVLETVFDA